jgi:hypothetical protein
VETAEILETNNEFASTAGGGKGGGFKDDAAVSVRSGTGFGAGKGGVAKSTRTWYNMT